MLFLSWLFYWKVKTWSNNEENCLNIKFHTHAFLSSSYRPRQCMVLHRGTLCFTTSCMHCFLYIMELMCVYCSILKCLPDRSSVQAICSMKKVTHTLLKLCIFYFACDGNLIWISNYFLTIRLVNEMSHSSLFQWLSDFQIFTWILVATCIILELIIDFYNSPIMHAFIGHTTL